MIAAGAEEVAENMKQQQAEAEQTAVDETHDWSVCWLDRNQQRA